MTAFALITPDAVVDGRVAHIIGTFRSNGLTIASLEYIPVEAAVMLRVYGGTSYALPGPSGELERVPSSLVDRVFHRAPGIVVDFEPDTGIYETVLRIKGATDPFEAEPGSIRRGGRDALINSLHCPDDAPSAESERAVLTSTEPGTMTRDAVDAFIELDRLAFTAASLDLESTLVRVLLRRRANALRHGTTPLLGSVDPDGLVALVTRLDSADESIARRRHFNEWAANNVSTVDVLGILEQLASNPGAEGPEAASSAPSSAALCRHDQDLVDLGLAVERSRSNPR